MTMENTDDRVTFSGDGSTTEFPYSFPTEASSDLSVTLQTVATGAETPLAETTDYTATYGVSGGTVTTVATYSSAYEIQIRRITPRTHTFNPVGAGLFDVEECEDTFDRVFRILVELTEDTKRCLRVTGVEDALDLVPNLLDRRGEFLYFDAVYGQPETEQPSGWTTTSTTSTSTTSTSTSTSTSTTTTGP